MKNTVSAWLRHRHTSAGPLPSATSTQGAHLSSHTRTPCKEHYFKANPTKSSLMAIPPWPQAPPPVMGKTNWTPGTVLDPRGNISSAGRCPDRGSGSCCGDVGDAKPPFKSWALNFDPPNLSSLRFKTRRKGPFLPDNKGRCRNSTANICIVKLPSFIFCLKEFLYRVNC